MNSNNWFIDKVLYNLTLTRVVFEFAQRKPAPPYISDLTLTRVVFELGYKFEYFGCYPKFNFNKSCIWIHKKGFKKLLYEYLTLTRVVFE